MTKFKWFAYLAAAAVTGPPASAQQPVQGVTATQAVLHYQAPAATVCQVQVSPFDSFTVAEFEPHV